MSKKLQFNPSTGLLSLNPLTGLLQTAFSGGDDCCCFLDPDTLTYSSIVTYDINDRVEYIGNTYNSRQDNNLNNTPSSSPAWWELISDEVSCENDGWDSFPPFGGIGRTPKFYSVTFTGVRLCATGELWEEINTTHTLTQRFDNPCVWEKTIGINIIRLTLKIQSFISTRLHIIKGLNAAFSLDLIGPCVITGSGDNSIAVIGDCGGRIYGYDGSAEYEPLA